MPGKTLSKARMMQKHNTPVNSMWHSTTTFHGCLREFQVESEYILSHLTVTTCFCCAHCDES